MRDIRMQPRRLSLIDHSLPEMGKLRSIQGLAIGSILQESMFQMRIEISSAGRTLTTNMLNV